MAQPPYDYERWENRAKQLAHKSPLRRLADNIVPIAGILALVIGGKLILEGYFDSGFLINLEDDQQNFWADVGMQLIGIAATILVIDRLYQQQQKNQLKQDLIIDMGSPVNDVARQAITVLWSRGWLQNGSVCGAKIWDANLKDADLGECDLRGINFWRSDLRNARLWSDLRGANLFDCDLEGAKFHDDEYGTAQFDETTVLPDGTFAATKTTPQDLERFTNREHPQFWRSEHHLSPAYRYRTRE
jgi:hypothetical protein